MNKPHAFNGSLTICLTCQLPAGHAIHSSQPIQVLNANGAAVKYCCSGHTCPKCHEVWTHDYYCNKKSEGLCTKCATQTTAEINRPLHLQVILQSSKKHLTGEEENMLKLQYEEFVCLNIIQNPDGSENPNWREKLQEHIHQIEKIIEQCQVKIKSSKKAGVDQENKEMLRLSPEEALQYARDAAKLKKSKPAKVDAVASTTQEQLILSLLKTMKLKDTPANRQMIESIALAKGN